MKASEIVEILRNAIAATKESGVENISLADLEAYAARLEKTAAATPDDMAAGEAVMEKYRADHKEWLSSVQQQHENSLEMLRSTITVGQSALKSALLINGGASVALLAFIGTVWSSNGAEPVVGCLAEAMLHYVAGVLSAAVAAGATYFSQAGYAGGFGAASKATGRVGHVLAILGVLAAYILFGRGSWLSFLSLGGG